MLLFNYTENPPPPPTPLYTHPERDDKVVLVPRVHADPPDVVPPGEEEKGLGHDARPVVGGKLVADGACALGAGGRDEAEVGAGAGEAGGGGEGGGGVDPDGLDAHQVVEVGGDDLPVGPGDLKSFFFFLFKKFFGLKSFFFFFLFKKFFGLKSFFLFLFSFQKVFFL